MKVLLRISFEILNVLFLTYFYLLFP
jgi:hypothetical protein